MQEQREPSPALVEAILRLLSAEREDELVRIERQAADLLRQRRRLGRRRVAVGEGSEPARRRHAPRLRLLRGGRPTESAGDQASASPFPDGGDDLCVE